MSSTAIFLRHKSLRWAVPAVVVAATCVLGSGVLSAQASPDLPPLSAAQLLAAVEQAHVDGFSGQVVENASLGLPELPDVGGSGAANSMISLLSGSHTTRIWYAGPTKQRVALLSTIGETDIFHNGTDLWQWDSDSKTATHTTLLARDEGHTAAPNPVESSTLTPQQLAQQALSAIDPSTIVTTDQARHVAGRSAYDLVLAPRDTSSRIGSVRIAIDSTTKIPLAVEVYPRGDTVNAAIDVSFSSIDFAVPADSEFAFTPPKTAIIKEGDAANGSGGGSAPNDSGGGSAPSGAGSAEGTKVLGTGWTSVVEYKGSGPIGSNPTSAPQVQSLLGALSPVSGAWGSGRLFASKLVTVLLTDDGRIFAGAVDPSVLYADAAANK